MIERTPYKGCLCSLALSSNINEMALVIEITSAPDENLIGKKFPVRPGLSIGRKRGEILLKDSKVSSLHASVEIEPSGDYVLRDENSSNGTWVNNSKVDKVILTTGATFQIGNYNFKVVELSEGELERLGIELMDWRTGIVESLKNFNYSRPDESTPLHVMAFYRPVRLTYTHGPFLEQSFTLGYGPRLIGYNNFDVEILDPQLPESIFELIPENKKIRIRNICGSQLLLNNKNFESEILNEDDVLRIASHQMKVNYIL